MAEVKMRKLVSGEVVPHFIEPYMPDREDRVRRLIDADELYTTYCNRYEGNVPCAELDRVSNAIASAPTIDPESLRPSGRWVDRYGGKYANPLYECSECKGKALYKVEVDVLRTEHIVQALSDACPHCGAKMITEEDHG